MSKERIADRVIQVANICIGDKIRKLRIQAGYKQSDFVAKLQASGLDISIYSYNRIENGTQNPTVQLLLLLCDIFNCSMDEIFGRQ